MPTYSYKSNNCTCKVNGLYKFINENKIMCIGYNYESITNLILFFLKELATNNLAIKIIN